MNTSNPIASQTNTFERFTQAKKHAHNHPHKNEEGGRKMKGLSSKRLSSGSDKRKVWEDEL